MFSFVVNCFQIFLSSWWFATLRLRLLTLTELWIAFKFFYLRDGSQLLYHVKRNIACCELLSNFSIFVMVRNFTDEVETNRVVVNCFQIFLSSWWFATLTEKRLSRCALWIAFKFFYLRDGSQLYGRSRDQQSSCELLSNFSIFVMVRNFNGKKAIEVRVVNCFQIFLSSWWFATFEGVEMEVYTLWIAFKFFYLRDGSQPAFGLSKLLMCCELLSNFSIFVMVRNCIQSNVPERLVVNCFQIFLSSWWFATKKEMK